MLPILDSVRELLYRGPLVTLVGSTESRGWSNIVGEREGGGRKIQEEGQEGWERDLV